jgi:biopolymer transport protein ExbD
MAVMHISRRTILALAATLLAIVNSVAATNSTTSSQNTRRPYDSLPFWSIPVFFVVTLLVIFLFLSPQITQEYRVRRLPQKHKLKQIYASFSEKEKEKITSLKEDIQTFLNVYSPGYAKHFDAWGSWSNEARVGLKKELEGTNVMKHNAVSSVMYYMKKAEMAMRDEKRAREKWAMREEKVKEAQHLAALMWGIYWPQEVEKAKAQKAKKQGLTVAQLDAQV